LYTNEHVVRPGIKQGENVTGCEKRYIGKVIFTPARAGQRENNATVLSTNSHAKQGVANLTDWALTELEYHPGLIEMPDKENKIRNRCNHVNGITHVPTQGCGAMAGAVSKRAHEQPWRSNFCDYPFSNEGVFYRFSKNRQYGNQKELQCWTLNRPKGVNELEWYNSGLGTR
jgi:hypothetical protein